MNPTQPAAPLTQILTPQQQLAQSCFELQRLPFPEVACRQVRSCPAYGKPEWFLSLEIQRDSRKLIAHVLEAKRPNQAMKIVLPLTEEVLEALESPALSVSHVPFHVDVDVFTGTLYLVGFNTLWNLYFPTEAAPYAQIGDDSYDLREVESVNALWANRNIPRYENGKLVSQNQELFTKNIHHTVRADAKNQVTVTDPTTGETQFRFTLRNDDERKSRLHKIQLVGDSHFLAAHIGDLFKLIDLKAQQRQRVMPCTDFHVNAEGLGVILYRQTLKILNLMQVKHLVELNTSSSSQHVHLSDGIPHVIHGNQCFHLNLQHLKTNQTPGYRLTRNGYRFTPNNRCPFYYMTSSDLIRSFTSQSHHRLSQIHGCAMIQTDHAVLQVSNTQKSAVEIEFPNHERLMPILEARLDQNEGFFAPFKSGQIYFNQGTTHRRRALLPENVLAHLRVSELRSMTLRVQAHQHELGFEMYMRWMHGQKALSYEHHRVTVTPDGKTLVSATHWNALRFWDTQTGKLMQHLEIPAGETLLDEAVAQCVFLPDSDDMVVIMHSGRIYRVNHYMHVDAKFELVYQVAGFSRIDVSWVQHQRFALICEGCWDDKAVYSVITTHSQPVILDLVTLTPHKMPALHEQSYSERPIAVCAEGRFLLIDATTTMDEYIVPFHQRVMDLHQEGVTTSWMKSDDLIDEVSDIAPNGVFHALSEDMKLKTFQWGMAKD